MTSRYYGLVATFSMVLVLCGCKGDPSLNVLDPAGTVGEKQLDLIKWSFIMMTGIFAIVISIFTYVLIRFRKRKGKEVMPEQVHGNTKLEIIWTVIPIILLAVLAYPTVRTTFDLAAKPTEEDAMVVKVTGHQYWWEFEYPELGIKTAQEFHVPVGRKVLFEIHGRDVQHAFWIPALGGKVDVIPGRVNRMWLDSKKPGLYHGKCAELCGAGHALMNFEIFAEEEDKFNEWVETMNRSPLETITPSAKKGEEIFLKNCIGCHAGSDPVIKGPNLDKFNTRTTIAGILKNNDLNLRNWLIDPPTNKPGTRMPKINYLGNDEMDALIDYLKTRK